MPIAAEGGKKGPRSCILLQVPLADSSLELVAVFLSNIAHFALSGVQNTSFFLCCSSSQVSSCPGIGELVSQLASIIASWFHLMGQLLVLTLVFQCIAHPWNGEEKAGMFRIQFYFPT